MTSPNGTQPRPINGYPSVSAAARSAGMTRQDYKRALQDAKRKKFAKQAEKRRKWEEKWLARKMAEWEQMEQH
jgi:hypothetical protein